MNIERDQRIMEMAIQGYSYRAIAQEVGCATGTVSNVVNAALYQKDLKAAELRELKDEQLAELQVKLREAAIGGDGVNLQAVDRLLKTMELRMKMRGLLKEADVQNNNVFVLPDNLTPEQIVELAKQPLLAEANVIDGEVISTGGEQSYNPPGDTQ